MEYRIDKQKRKSIRLRGYDYSKQGYYFITICTKQRECILGDINSDNMMLNDIGRIVDMEWMKSFQIRTEINLINYIIMPNHIHGILKIVPNVGANGGLPPSAIPENRANCHSTLHMKPKSLSSFIAGFKSSVSRKTGFSIWQRNYYERIIRNKKELDDTKNYISLNPSKWDSDENNPLNFFLV